ncbi:hypothetical protein LCGC14_2820420 [marine sediment metagenome]|uniref:SpoVT-AbrB domain-containing protein n=1 Tax=marine sediment metagenome TaxID=412755 RepID=A0A0F8Z3V6_9ZZZZ
MEIETETRKWGSSLGIIIPKKIVEKENLKQKQKIKILAIETEQKTSVKDIFGKLKFKRPIQEILDEVDRDFEPEVFA